MMEKFSAAARKVSDYAGKPVTFLVAVALVIGWALTGPLFGFSDTWQLICNTGTTIITFLMVFLIQSSQNTDTKALHLKMDDIICSLEKADNKLINIERGSEHDIEDARRRIDLASNR